MLEVQRYLLSGKTLDDLSSELSINIKSHESLPLVILNYSQIDSPRGNPIADECRGLVLERDTWRVVGRAFNRFYNLEEMIEHNKAFVWDRLFDSLAKEDGSLVIVYYYDGWKINSRNSFGEEMCGESGLTWDEHVRPFLKKSFTHMDKSYTYVFEYCSIWNKIVRTYKTPTLFLLSVFNGEEELPSLDVDDIAVELSFSRPEHFDFLGVGDIRSFLSGKEKEDPTFEGVVVKDINGMRIKIKSKSYFDLHRIRGNNVLPLPKHLLPFVLKDEGSEILSYFPEFTEEYERVKCIVDAEMDKLIKIWGLTWQIENQKEFALAIKDATIFSGILFAMRKKYKAEQTVDLLTQEWRASEELICKRLF